MAHSIIKPYHMYL